MRAIYSGPDRRCPRRTDFAARAEGLAGDSGHTRPTNVAMAFAVPTAVLCSVTRLRRAVAITVAFAARCRVRRLSAFGGLSDIGGAHLYAACEMWGHATGGDLEAGLGLTEKLTTVMSEATSGGVAGAGLRVARKRRKVSA